MIYNDFHWKQRGLDFRIVISYAIDGNIPSQILNLCTIFISSENKHLLFNHAKPFHGPKIQVSIVLDLPMTQPLKVYLFLDGLSPPGSWHR